VGGKLVLSTKPNELSRKDDEYLNSKRFPEAFLDAVDAVWLTLLKESGIIIGITKNGDSIFLWGGRGRK
jgi:hypothetical protein